MSETGGFEFTHDGKSIGLDDVPLSVYADIEKETGVAWFDLSVSPMRYAAAGAMLAAACAKQLGVELPEMTPRTLVDVFNLRESESRPTEWTDGMPDPKAEDSDPETI